MKKILILIASIVLFNACQTKETYADKQPNGLHYKFLDYVGPDSCKLYRCAYNYGEGEHEVSNMLLTICKDKNVTTSYTSGKQHITNYTVMDTVVNMVPKMVPETSLVIKHN